MSYALVSLSCTIPLFIAVVSTTFTSANFVSGLATFVAYALGMGVVLVALTVALALARQSLVRSVRRVLPYVYQVSGRAAPGGRGVRGLLRLVRAARRPR